MPSSAPRRCLLVDDDEAMRVLMRLQLEGAGITVVTAASVETARKLIDDESPAFAMVVADHRLPGGTTGVDVLRHAREADPDTELVLLSAHFQPGTVSGAEELGAMLVDKADPEPISRRWRGVTQSGGQ